jgi:tol-pal system protein YbgF
MHPGTVKIAASMLGGNNMGKTRSTAKWMIVATGLLLFGCAAKEDVLILDNQIRHLQSQFNIVQKDLEPLRKGTENYRREVAELREANILTKAELSAEIKKMQADQTLRMESLQSEVRNFSTGVEEIKDFAKKPTPELILELERLRVRAKTLEEKGRALEEKNRALEERVRATDERFKWVEDRLKGAEERSKSAEERSKSAEERSKSAEERLRGGEERLRGSEDRLKGLDGKLEQVGAKQSDLEKRMATRETKDRESPPPTTATVESSKVPPAALVSSGDLYKDAYATYQRGDIEESRKKFEIFLKNYPNTELSDNAQFWIGETFYRQKDYERAIIEYEKVIVKYPEGDKVSAAVLKQGMAFLDLGDKTNAKNLFRRVVERYPQSEQAELARKRLEGIK